jgi:glucose/arabinose dehydrogenase
MVGYRVIVLAAVLVLAAAGSVAAQVCGDADGNADVDVTDGVRTLQEAAGLGGRCASAATCDLDGDGRISVADGVNVLRLAADLPTFTACPIVPALRLAPVATGLSGPLFVSGAPGEAAGRLFVVEQGGTIRLVENGVTRDPAFLDISALTSDGGERGLLGLAFHPGYASNRRFYVYYTGDGGDLVTAEYLREASDPNRAVPTANRLLRTIPHPISNHNGGMLAFGPDGFLYVGPGDGGGGGDPDRNGQNPGTKLGKILRIDVDGDAPPPGNLAGADPDVWDLGLRNPFRFSFDRATGDLYIGDVGQNSFEEVNVEPAGQGGRNYGWNVMEGFACFGASQCDQTGLTLPAVAYPQDNGTDVDDCSVIGGYVYRGSAIPALRGRYLYGDLCTRRVRSFVWNGSAAVSEVELSAALASETTLGTIASFGEDVNGELYIADLGGTVYRIEPQ